MKTEIHKPPLMDIGLRFQKALRSLGLRVDAMIWGYDVAEAEFFLFIVWPGLEKYGPLSVSKLLYRAYNAAALPEEIDPLLVQIMGRHHGLAGHIMGLSGDGDHPTSGSEHPHIHFQSDWIICRSKRHSTVEVATDWKRFREAVAGLAA